jgi:hypothetical protein
MNPILKSIVTRLLGTVIRHGLSALGLWLAAKGAGTFDANAQSNVAELIIGGICVLVTAGWSYYKSHNNDKKIEGLEKIASAFSTLGKQESPPPSINPLPLIAVMFFSAFVAGATTSCAVVGGFDQNSYDSGMALKSESAALIAHAGEPASDYKQQIQALTVKLDAQLAYQNGKGKTNLISAKQWDILISPEHDLLGKLLLDWVEGKNFSDEYLLEKRQQISDAWDQILKLEGAKKR